MPAIFSNRLFNQGLFWGFFAFISYKFLAQSAHSGINIPHLDKIVHAGIFFWLGFFLIRAYTMSRWQHFVVLGIYGALIEWLQGRTGYRSADIYDWIADALGVVAIFITLDLYQNMGQKEKQKRQNRNG